MYGIVTVEARNLELYVFQTLQRVKVETYVKPLKSPPAMDLATIDFPRR